MYKILTTVYLYTHFVFFVLFMMIMMCNDLMCT